MRDRPLLKLALTPRWILALLLAIVIAVIFALLGQWQLSRAVESATPSTQPTETVVPLTSVASPQQAPVEGAIDQRVSVKMRIAGDFSVLAQRYNGADEGYWLIARAEVGANYSLAVALGWSPTEQGAKDAASAVDTTSTVEVTGRYLASESPEDKNYKGPLPTAMAVPALVNVWPDVGAGVYAGYLVVATPPVGLSAISSPEPSKEVSYNLLNLFYAIEWIVFAGLAFFLWYRLLKDAHERELEDAEEAEEARRAAALATDAERATIE